MSEFDAFFRNYSQRIYTYLARLIGDRDRAHDLFQRVFLKAYTHFEARRSPGSERSWIYMIATNEARDEVRRRKRDPERRLAPEHAESLAEPDPTLSPEDRELAREILLGLEALPPAQKEVFLLVRYHGFTFAEAALLCGMSLSGAKMSVSRAHEKLLRRLAGRIDLGSLL